MPSIRLTGDIAHIMEGTRAQAADLNLTLAEDGFPVAVTIIRPLPNSTVAPA